MSGDSQAQLSANSDSGSRFRRFEASIHSASKDFQSKSAVLNPLANEWEAVKEARQMFQKEVEEDPLEGCPILYDPFFFFRQIVWESDLDDLYVVFFIPL